MTKISAVIITLNEELRIENCLQSLEGIADEIIVVDSYSTDSTEKVCRRYNVRFVQHPFSGFMDQKNYSLTLVSNKYVLSLDADEELSDDLRKAILDEKNDLKFDGYLFNRSNHYCGKWIRHSGWYPDRQLRLFNSEMGRWGTMNVHETFRMVSGSRIKKIKGDLLHYSYDSGKDLLDKIEMYSEIGATEFHKAGRKVYFTTPYLHMIWHFIRTYIILFGFLDGRYGYAICYWGAYSTYLKYIKLRKLYQQATL